MSSGQTSQRLRHQYQQRRRVSAATLRQFYQRQVAQFQQKLGEAEQIEEEVAQAVANHNVAQAQDAQHDLDAVRAELRELREQLRSMKASMAQTEAQAPPAQPAAGSAEESFEAKEEMEEAGAAAAAPAAPEQLADEAPPPPQQKPARKRYGRRRVFIESLGSSNFTPFGRDDPPLPAFETK